MRIVVRLVIVAALTWLTYVVYTELSELWAIDPDSADYDPTMIIVYFLMIVALGIAVGLLLASTIIPAIGDQIGHFFFTPNEQIEKDAHAEAIALVNQGEYAQAVDAYKAIVRKDPSDMHAISEVIHLYCDKMGEYEAAGDYLEGFLQEERPAEETSFLAERLVDVYWNYQQEAEPAMVILKQLMERLPGTSHSANAFHRLREIEAAVGLPLTNLPQTEKNVDEEAIADEQVADDGSLSAEESEADSAEIDQRRDG